MNVMAISTARIVVRLGIRAVCGFALLIGFGSYNASANLQSPVEIDSWSDMAFPGNVLGGFDQATKTVTLSAMPSNSLEIGSRFGPSHGGALYGSNGTLGGPFSATLTLGGVVVGADGIVSNGGTVTIAYSGGVSGSIGTDYGIPTGNALLSGSVREVLLDATGDNTLDVFVNVTGGALQNDNPDPAVGVFSPSGQAILRIAGVKMPSDWSQGFILSGSTIDVLGLPAADENNDSDLFASSLNAGANYVGWRKSILSSAAAPLVLSPASVPEPAAWQLLLLLTALAATGVRPQKQVQAYLLPIAGLIS